MTIEPYHEVRAQNALARIANGEVPAEFCSEQDPNVPSFASSVEVWAQTDVGFAARLRDAKATGAVVMLSQCKHIADDRTIRADQKRLMIDTRMKIAAIWNPENCTAIKPESDPPAGIQAFLHVPYEQLGDDKKRDIERFFGFS